MLSASPLTCDEDLVAYNFQWASLSPEFQKLGLYKEKDIVLGDNSIYVTKPILLLTKNYLKLSGEFSLYDTGKDT